jgi:hypothetical protein
MTNQPGSDGKKSPAMPADVRKAFGLPAKPSSRFWATPNLSGRSPKFIMNRNGSAERFHTSSGKAAGVNHLLGRLLFTVLLIPLLASTPARAQKYITPDGKLRVALVKQPFSPTGTSVGPNTMANGGVQSILAGMNTVVRVTEVGLTPAELTEYGAWKKLGWALGHFSDVVAQNERDGFFTVGLLATCPSMPGLVAGLQRSGAAGRPLKIGMLWLDAHPEFVLSIRWSRTCSINQRLNK